MSKLGPLLPCCESPYFAFFKLLVSASKILTQIWNWNVIAAGGRRCWSAQIKHLWEPKSITRTYKEDAHYMQRISNEDCFPWPSSIVQEISWLANGMVVWLMRSLSIWSYYPGFDKYIFWSLTVLWQWTRVQISFFAAATGRLQTVHYTHILCFCRAWNTVVYINLH